MRLILTAVLPVLLVPFLAACEEPKKNPLGDSLEAISDFSNTTSYISSVSGIAWEWGTNGSGSVDALLPTAYGLIVSHSSASVTALHGESGTELWTRESMGSRSTVSVTPDGLGTVFVDRVVNEEGAEEAGELVLIDVGTGEELAASPAPENSISRTDLVTENHILVPQNGEITAHDLRSGEPSWTYSPKPHCLGIPDYARDEDWRWPVTTVEGAVLLPIVCSIEGSDPPELQDQDVAMFALALDEGDGTELWVSEPARTTLWNDPMEHLYNYSLIPSDDGKSLIQGVSQEFRLLDATTGEQVEARWPENGTGGISLENRVSTTNAHVVWYEEPESEGPDYRYVKYAHNGDVLDEISTIANQHALTYSDPWSSQGRVADLPEGLLTYHCENRCLNTGNPGKPLTATFTPWGEGDSVTLELDQLDAHQDSENKWARFLPVPGAVIGYQEQPGEFGSPLGTLVALA